MKKPKNSIKTRQYLNKRGTSFASISLKIDEINIHKDALTGLNKTSYYGYIDISDCANQCCLDFSFQYPEKKPVGEFNNTFKERIEKIDLIIKHFETLKNHMIETKEYVDYLNSLNNNES